MNTEIRAMEEQLRSAMLTGDVATLDKLIDDRLLFIGPDSAVYRKEDDLELHRSGQEKLTKVDIKDIQIESHGSLAITVVLVDLAGVFKGQSFENRVRYLRTWVHTDKGWRVIAGSVSTVVA